MKSKVTAKDIIAYTWHIWRPNAGRLPVLIALKIIGAGFDVLFPIIIGLLIDNISGTSKGIGLFTSLGVLFGAFVLCEVLYHSFRAAGTYLWNKFAVCGLYAILSESFARVQRFPTDWHANSFAGATVRKITRGMWAFDAYADVFYYYMIGTFFVLIGTVGVMFTRWPIMGAVTLAVVSLYIVVNIIVTLKINAPLFRHSAETDTAVGATLADSITANATVKAFGTEVHEDGIFARVTRHWADVSLHAWQVSNVTDLARRLVATFMMAMMVGTAIYLWQQGRATAGDVVYVLTSYLVLSNYLRDIGQQIANILKAISEMEDVVLFWKRKPVIKERDNAPDLVAETGRITFDKVNFTYDNQHTAIYNDFNLNITAGEKVALVGKSGSGKSTFVKLIQRLYDVQGGEIRIDGQNIADVTLASLRRSIALVPQDPVLFHRSLAVNIAYGKPEATMDEIIDAAKKAYAHDFIKDLPAGYDTLVGERGIKLSGGERQRVAIARAILADAPLLVLDEATSSLDSISEHYIQKALETLMEGKTTITIAHRLATIKAVDRILVFDNGRIVEQGTHTELLKRTDSHYKKLYDMQALDLVG